MLLALFLNLIDRLAATLVWWQCCAENTDTGSFCIISTLNTSELSVRASRRRNLRRRKHHSGDWTIQTFRPWGWWKLSRKSLVKRAQKIERAGIFGLQLLSSTSFSRHIMHLHSQRPGFGDFAFALFEINLLLRALFNWMFCNFQRLQKMLWNQKEAHFLKIHDNASYFLNTKIMYLFSLKTEALGFFSSEKSCDALRKKNNGFQNFSNR